MYYILLLYVPTRHVILLDNFHLEHTFEKLYNVKNI